MKGLVTGMTSPVTVLPGVTNADLARVAWVGVEAASIVVPIGVGASAVAELYSV